jgi:hypothetical protein
VRATPDPKGKAPEWVDIALILTAFFALVAVVNPRGNFPLDDDWNFALATWNFAKTGTIRLARFTAMSLRLQIVWGALWTHWWGASFEVLRASTIAIAALALLLMDRFARAAGLGRGMRLLTVATLLAHPIFFWGTFTYMTQVPFLTMSIAAVFCQFKGLSGRSLLWLTAGSGLVIAACFIRQTGIALAVPPLLVLLIHVSDRNAWRSKAFAIAALPLLLFAALFLGTSLLEGYPNQMAESAITRGAGGAALLWRLAFFPLRNTVMNFELSALCSLPVVIAVAQGVVVRSTRGVRIAALFVAIPFFGMTSFLVGIRDPFPYRIKGQVLINAGLGPATLRDTFAMGFPYPHALPILLLDLLSYVFAALGVVVLIALLQSLLGPRAQGTDDATAIATRLLSWTAVAGCGLPVISFVYFDRYELDSLWPLVLLFAIVGQGVLEASSRLRILAWTAAGVLLLFSVGATQEYLSWNRARWRAVGLLRREHVPLTKVDGGYEVNQYLVGGFDAQAPTDRLADSAIYGSDYVIALHPLIHYQAMARFPYAGFFGARRGDVLLLKKRPRGAR